MFTNATGLTGWSGTTNAQIKWVGGKYKISFSFGGIIFLSPRIFNSVGRICKSQNQKKAMALAILKSGKAQSKDQASGRRQITKAFGYILDQILRIFCYCTVYTNLIPLLELLAMGLQLLDADSGSNALSFCCCVTTKNLSKQRKKA